jgi:hypothetical protein
LHFYMATYIKDEVLPKLLHPFECFFPHI